MASERRFHPLVADDLKAATSYYDGISSEIGNRFRAAVRVRFETISARPESFGCIYGVYRAAIVERFPYIIMFETKNDQISILGVFHAASNRDGWFDRSLS